MSTSSKGREIDYGKIGDVHLAQVPEVGDCNPGMNPVEYNIIIAPAKMADKIGSILLSDETKDQQGMAMQVGRVVAVSPLAFNYDNWPEGAQKPTPGDIIWYARFAGGLFTGLDDKQYRIIKDKDVGAVITPLAKPVAVAQAA